MEKKPGINVFDIVNFQKKNHALGSAEDQETVYEVGAIFILPFRSYFCIFVVNFYVEFWGDGGAECNTRNLLIKIPVKRILYLILMKHLFQYSQILIINSIDTN